MRMMQANGPLKFIQITDTHLYKDAKSKLLGISTQETLKQVLAHVIKYQSDIQCVVLTGDLTQDRTIESYQYLRDSLKNLPYPSYWLCGNHDDLNIMSQVATKQQLSSYVNIGKWNLLLLDSQSIGHTYGNLRGDQLDFLQSSLAENQSSPTLIALHHPPVNVSNEWLNEIQLKNHLEFWKIVTPYKHVKGVFWGHIHQEFLSERDDIKLYGCPSTSVQFKPHQTEFCCDTLMPGYRVFKIHPDGSMESHVQRVALNEFTLNFKAKKYE
jgi:Icc protein